MSKRGKGSLKMMSQPDNKDSSLGPIKGNSPLLQKDSEQRKNKLKQTPQSRTISEQWGD